MHGDADIRPSVPGNDAQRRISHLAIAALLVIHTGLLGFMANRDSPTWDEVAHFAAGLNHWYTGTFPLYRVNPPLIRMIATAPAALARTPMDDAQVSLYGDPALRLEFRSGTATAQV